MKSLKYKIFHDLDEIIIEYIKNVIVDSHTVQEVLDNTYRIIRDSSDFRWDIVDKVIYEITSR
jgi:hypothetical protein